MENLNVQKCTKYIEFVKRGKILKETYSDYKKCNTVVFIIAFALIRPKYVFPIV